MNTVFVGRQVSLSHVTGLPIPLSPTTHQASMSLATFAIGRIEFPVHTSSRFRLWAASSPHCIGRIGFVILRMDRSLSVALHLASRRRNYFQLQPRRCGSGGLPPPCPVRFQAHDPGLRLAGATE